MDSTNDSGFFDFVLEIPVLPAVPKDVSKVISTSANSSASNLTTFKNNDQNSENIDQNSENKEQKSGNNEHDSEEHLWRPRLQLQFLAFVPFGGPNHNWRSARKAAL